MRIATAILGAALASGCKDQPKPQPVQPLAGSGEPASASGHELPGAEAAGSAGSAAPDLAALPRPSGSGPVPTTQPLDRARYEKMASLDYPGWSKDVRHLSDRGLEVRYRAVARPPLGVTIVASPCFDCLPPELPKWRTKEAALRNLLVPELRERKDTVFEVGEVKLAGAPLIFTYQLAYAQDPDGDQQRPGPYSNAYTVHHNDGVNQIRVTAQYAGAPVGTRDELAKLAPREDLRRIALAFLDAYTHAW